MEKPVCKIHLDELEMKKQRVHELLAELKRECDNLAQTIIEVVEYQHKPNDA